MHFESYFYRYKCLCDLNLDAVELYMFTKHWLNVVTIQQYS